MPFPVFLSKIYLETEKVFLPNRPLMPQKSNALHDVIRICKAWHGLNSTDINKFFSSFSRQNPISLTRHAKPAHLCSFLTHHRPCSGQSSKHSQAFSATLPPLPTHTHTHSHKGCPICPVLLPLIVTFFFLFCCSKLSQNYQIPRNPSMPPLHLLPFQGISLLYDCMCMC